ncbi:carbohydrate kinase [Sulfurovum sp. TSL1]|uniref:carbohydrate kinase family protein n=1 Tax=Sulfurovum sp. TSL1 TaxID=2826994 RepID=UPI001CC59B6F|nr:carbohydrate kinase [Sulfurovum sp. TSL1]GIT97901.1 fructokinase [Sulfurovum sp. TSL1]
MSDPTKLLIFGEVLFDCFPTGERILGGAPFNVAWHLQAFGDTPRLISRVGDDALGKKILSTMETWGLSLSGIQIDPIHQTGRVDVKFVHDEPHYTITPDSAYDFIDAHTIDREFDSGILYHGTLGLRNEVSRNALSGLTQDSGLSIFLDVNLRTPWWKKEEVYQWIKKAHWVKLNEEELRLLDFTSSDIDKAMADLQMKFGIEQLILTRGKEGATVRTRDGQLYHKTPESVEHITDTVGAGDAFSAMYIHGLMSGWSIPDTLSIAQRFAGKVLGLRGATTTDRAFYQDTLDDLMPPKR